MSKVTNMQSMFNAHNFNATGLGSWDVSKVTDMSYMFYVASKFNDDISNWNVGQVQQMGSMFNGASIFNADITGWKPKTSCTDAERNSGNCFIWKGWDAKIIIFRACSQAPRSGSIRTPTAALTTPTSRCARRRRTRARTHFTTGRRTRGQQVRPPAARETLLLRSCLLLHFLSQWSGASARFPSGEACCSTGGANCGAACGVDMPSWDTSLVTDMSGLFSNKYSFNQDISGWDVSKVTDMSNMFSRPASSIRT